MASTKTFKGERRKLFVLYERTVDLDVTKIDGIDMEPLISFPVWEHYIDLLRGPIYVNLVKDFWLHAYIDQASEEDFKIKSLVWGNPITITPSSITDAIRCPHHGEDIEKYRNNSPFAKDIGKLLSESYDKTKDITLGIRIWHMLIINNLLPRSLTPESISLDDKHLLLFLFQKTRINLPLIIFNHLKSTIIASRKGNIYSIPYGRVLSILFHKEGMTQKGQKLGSVKASALSWGNELIATMGDDLNDDSYSSDEPNTNR
ncbi:hypothetical protein A2U01_0028897, partial [Trifolium medium]|nr:hypothetical protein [Trifolium medium]